MNLNELPLYLQTLPYLRTVQVLYRARCALRNRVRLLIGTSAASNGKVAATAWSPIQFVTPPLTYPWVDASDIAQRKFTFLNDSLTLGDQIDWKATGKSRLWRYNMHYFQYLHPAEGLPDDSALGLMREWVDRNPPGTADAWDPFPISLRVVNWIRYLSLHGTPGCFQWDDLARSIHAQMRLLERSLEYHLLGNHLFKNAKALVLAGLFFKGKDGERWLSKGLSILNKELDEQILPDGGHFERSPMYHTMILGDCLDLLNLLKGRQEPASRTFIEKLEEACRRMARFLLGMSHPDGEIALFNDAAFGIEARPADIAGYYERVTGEQLTHVSGDIWSFPGTGYFVMSHGEGDRLFIDCGPIGPDYQPGHAHCDTLSFELSLGGKRVVVDSGCFHYEKDEIRDYNRGNPGHNTITIDGKNQSEVWGAHRCAKRARPLYGRIEKRGDGTLVFEGAHDGYRRLSGSPIHHRRISWREGLIHIVDRVEGSCTHTMESRLHIHPELRVERSPGGADIKAGSRVIARVAPSGDMPLTETEGWYCPEFGKKHACTVLRTVCRTALPRVVGWRIEIRPDGGKS